MVDLGSLPRFVSDPNPQIYSDRAKYARPLFLDFETTNLEKGSALNPNNRLVLACWKMGWEGEVEYCWGSEYEQGELLEAVRDCDFVVAHNAKFELQWLERCGADLSSLIVYDTMLAEYVIGGNRWKTNRLGLTDCCARSGLEQSKLSTVGAMLKGGICPSEIPQSWLLRYCVRDVELLPKLMEKQLERMEGTKLLQVVYARCLFTTVLADIEKQGLRLDAERVDPLYDELTAKYEEITRALHAFSGGAKLTGPQFEKLVYETLEFPVPRVRKGGEWVELRTPTGRRPTKEDVISSLRASTKRQREFLSLYKEWKGVYNQLTKYVKKFKACCDADDGVLIGDFNQTQTYTHRTSSTGRKYSAQFQNFPRIYKRLFRARRDGWLIGESDGSQLEFRAAVHLGRDPVGVDDIASGFDIHMFSAGELTKAGEPTDRQGAKEHTFKPLYAGQSGTDAQRAYYQAFKDRYQGIAETQQRWITEVLETKKLETEYGLVYYWPDTHMTARGYITNTTAICNYPVQGFATAEIIPIALVCYWHRLRRMEANIVLVNTVHDSAIAELAPEEEERWALLSKQCMIDDVYHVVSKLYGVDIVAPLGCGVKVAPHWGDTKTELKFEADPSFYKGDVKYGVQRRSNENKCEAVGRPQRSHFSAVVSDRLQ